MSVMMRDYAGYVPHLSTGYVPLNSAPQCGEYPAMEKHSKQQFLMRLDLALKRAGKTDHSASVDAGLGKDAIRDLRRKEKTMPTLDTIAALAGSLDLEPEYLAFGTPPRDAPASSDAIRIKGEVAAGLWLEIDGSDEPEFEDHPVPFHPNYAREAQYGLIVRGTSINRVAAPGDVLQCIDLAISGLEPVSEDLVIVERRRAQAGQREVTAKRYRPSGKTIELVPDSDDARWANPFVIKPGRAPKDDEEIAVIAIVVGIYKPMRRPK
jgi:hypothetical protein